MTTDASSEQKPGYRKTVDRSGKCTPQTSCSFSGKISNLNSAQKIFLAGEGS